MKWFKRLALILVLCFVALAAIEGTASAALLLNSIQNRGSPGNFRQAAYDSLMGWVGLPNNSRPDFFGPGLTVTTNAAGMRMHRTVDGTLPNQKRLICSGDSFTYGSGVNDSDTFCAQLEHEVPGLETLNMAQPGYGIDQMYLWYKRDAAKYPHQVHVLAFIWHDFERMELTEFWDYPKPRLNLEKGALRVENVPVPQWSGPSRLTNISELFSQMRTVQYLRSRFTLSDSLKLARVDNKVWDVAEAVFTDLAKVNQANGSKLVLLYLPALPDLTAGAYDHRRERLAAFTAKTGITLIDLTTPMRQVPADSSEWYFITPNALPVRGSSGHYTALGHKWVAKELATQLRALDILKN